MNARRMHENSLAAYHDLEMGAREWQILECFRGCIHPMTDRECAETLGFTDLNMCRPRITSLIDKRLLIEVGSRKDSVTGRTVRICTNATIF